MCAPFFHTPARRHKMYTQASPRRLLPAKSVHTTRTPAPPAGWLYQPPGFAFRAKKCIHYAERFSSIMCIHKPPLLFHLLFYICFLFLQKVHILAGPRGSRREKEKVHTLGGHQEQNRIRQKVHTLGSPRFALFHMHTRLSRFCGRLRKSAYTSRTPQRQPQPPKSAYTRQPRFVCKKYAYKAVQALR